MSKTTFLLACAAAASFVTPVIYAQEMPTSEGIYTACPDEPKLRRKPRLVRDLSAFMILILQLEAQGQENFEIQYEPPKITCEKDAIKTDDGSARVLYSPFEPGMQTVLFRVFVKNTPEPREIAVVYSGVVSLLQDRGKHFYIAESQGTMTTYYAMYRDQPSYDAIKPILTDIVNGTATPLIVVRWPKNSDEAVVDRIDDSLM